MTKNEWENADFNFYTVHIKKIEQFFSHSSRKLV